MSRLPKCPGAFTRNIDSVLVPCPNCGRQVEIFTDEPKYRCRCGQLILRESMPKCADWCKAADQCLGEGIDREELERRLAAVQNDPRAKECLEKIRQRLDEKKRQQTSG